jgi:hypothetical protein
MFFFEKKNQKTFVPCFPMAAMAPGPDQQGIKVFLLLFLQKKKILSS